MPQKCKKQSNPPKNDHIHYLVANQHFMKFLLPTFSALALLLASCGGGEGKNNTPAQDSTKADSVVVDFPAEVDSLLAKFPLNETWPLVLDSALVVKTTESDSLSSADFRILSANYNKHELFDQQSWNMENFLKIDSIKIAGGYADYVASLDLGMTKDSKAYALFHMKPNDSTLLFFYGIDYGSYEACPWSRGTYVFMTVVYANTIGESICIALEDAGGDPPAYGSSSRSAELSKEGEIKIHDFNLSDEDMDAPEVQTKTADYVFLLKGSSILHKSGKEAEWTTVKRSTIE